MSDEISDDHDEVGLEEALDADNPKKERRFLIQKTLQIVNRLDNGMSEKVKKNSNFRENMTRVFWISLPILLGMFGTMLWFVIRYV